MRSPSFLIALLYLTSLVTAHFIVNTPPALGGGSNINAEGTAPCGGFSPSNSDNNTEFHVQGDAVGLTTLHSQCFLAYRGILGNNIANANWTTLVPTIEEFGLNSFCLPHLAAPEAWAGHTGLLQIIQDADDGVHYQCIPVKFVSGLGTAVSSCKNSSGVSANFASDSTLSNIESGSLPATTSGSGSPTSSASQAAASPTQSKSAAVHSAAAIEMIACGILAALAGHVMGF